jgi:hypothetical protein
VLNLTVNLWYNSDEKKHTMTLDKLPNNKEKGLWEGATYGSMVVELPF